MGRIWKMIRWKDSVCTLRLAWEIPWYQPLNQNCEFFTVFPILLENIYKAFSKTVLLANVITNLLRETTDERDTRRAHTSQFQTLIHLTDTCRKDLVKQRVHVPLHLIKTSYFIGPLYVTFFWLGTRFHQKLYAATVLIVFLLIVNFI